MRIGIFTESYQPLINGVSTSLRILKAELERAGHVVFVFTSRYPNYRDEEPGVYRYASVNAIVEPDYVLPIPFSPSIALAMPALKLDIVHSQSPFLLGLIARTVARRYGIPHVSTNHTLYTEYSHYVPLVSARLTRATLVSWMGWFYNQCDAVIAPSEFTRQRLISGYGVQRPVSVAPTGIPAPPYVLTSVADTKRELGVPKDARLLLYVGRLAEEKNLPMLLRAFREIANHEENAYLVIAGSGKSARSLRADADRLGVAERTRFTGFLGRTRLDPLYLASDAFLFPSKTETQGVAIGEAMAAGLPAVVVNAGGAPETVHDGVDGFHVEDDPRQMARRALQLLGDDDLRRRMSERAKETALSLAPARVSARVIEVYERALAEHKEASTRERNTPAAMEATTGGVTAAMESTSSGVTAAMEATTGGVATEPSILTAAGAASQNAVGGDTEPRSRRIATSHGDAHATSEPSSDAVADTRRGCEEPRGI